MKTIKINFYGFWEGFNYKDFFIYKILSEKYDVVIADNPDYAIISCFDYDYNFLKQKGIRIFYSGENIAPNFEVFDYAISFNYIEFGDRYFRYPLSIRDVYFAPIVEKRDINGGFIYDKKYFCTFMYSHEGCKERTELFNKISSYKRVESVGKYLKNSDIVIPKDKDNKSKLEFQGKAKFVLAVENESFPGYSTEKILHAFASHSIPIYYGDPEIAKEFNTKAFVNCHDYKSFDEVLERVKEIDNDDELYLSMMQEPVFNEDCYIMKKRDEVSKFLCNIFDQEYEKAFRRSLGGIAIDRENSLAKLAPLKRQVMTDEGRKLSNRIKRFFRGLK